MNDILQSSEYLKSSVLGQFLGSASAGRPRAFDLEDALPSTLSRKTALNLKEEAADVAPIAASYYPAWASSPTVANIKYAKFDIIFFGKLPTYLLFSELNNIL